MAGATEPPTPRQCARPRAAGASDAGRTGRRDGRRPAISRRTSVPRDHDQRRNVTRAAQPAITATRPFIRVKLVSGGAAAGTARLQLGGLPLVLPADKSEHRLQVGGDTQERVGKSGSAAAGQQQAELAPAAELEHVQRILRRGPASSSPT